MLDQLSYADLLDALAWQVEMGADEALAEAPIRRFDVPDEPLARTRAAVPARASADPSPAMGTASPAVPATPAGTAAALAAAARDLPGLRATMESFEGCALRAGARNLVADGNPAARLMVIGEAPGRDEDRMGLPFVGRSGQLLDRMLAAIGLDRHAEEPQRAAYITNTLPWRPPANREPSADEIAMMLPFLHRHITLKAPEVLLLVGSSAAKTVLQTSDGITRMRGRWMEWQGIPVIATFHPAALLRDPSKKREVWSDLLNLKVRLDG